jgi:TIGR03009 family protein
MGQLLQSWEKVSQANETLYAEFKRTDASPAFLDGPKQFVGRALLRKPNLACLEFEEVVKDRPKPVFNQRIVCAGDAVYQFLGPTKQVFVFPMAEDERRRALEEGPLPFMFNMRMAAAQERYTWDLLEETEAAGEAPATYIIRIIPRQAIDREEFSQALVKLNKETFLPIALRLYAPNGKDTKTFEFGKVERNSAGNPAANGANYDGPAMAKKFEGFGYKVIVNPDAETAGVGGAPASGGPAPAERAVRGAREAAPAGRR